MTTRFSPRRVTALARKETMQILRDPSTFLIAFVLPIVLLFLFGYGVSLDTSRTRVAVVLQDSGGPALRLAQAYQNSSYFDVTLARSVSEVRDLMTDEQIRALFVIPPDFSQGVRQGKMPAIQIITDGSQPNTASFVSHYGEGVRASWAMAEGLERNPRAAGASVSLSPRFWYNPELKSRYFLVPGAIANVMTMVGTLLTALVVAREWERGTMEAMMATPISMVEFVASKVIPYFLLAQCSMALCAILGVWVFGVPFRGSVFALFAISSAFLMPALGLGLFISAGTKNQFVASQAALLSAFLPTFLLSGFLYEIGSMPWPIQALTYLVPARYLIPCLETVFLAGDVWTLILPNIGIMLLFGLFFFYQSFRVTRRSLDK